MWRNQTALAGGEGPDRGGGAGSGGGILLVADTLEIDGSLQANGGAAPDTCFSVNDGGGGGGGGRIKLFYDSQITITGNTSVDAGTGGSGGNSGSGLSGSSGTVQTIQQEFP